MNKTRHSLTNSFEYDLMNGATVESILAREEEAFPKSKYFDAALSKALKRVEYKNKQREVSKNEQA